MTDGELDGLMRRVLVDALRADEAADESGPMFVPSRQYQRQTRAMLKDPLAWARRRSRPVWARVLQQAAAVLLVVSLSLGGFLAVVPDARAAVVNWAIEWYENRILYRFSGSPTSTPLPFYEITALPAGYVETERERDSIDTFIAYGNEAGDEIWFEYLFMDQGAATTVDTENTTSVEVTVNQMKGQFFQSNVSDYYNTMIWLDESQNILFRIDAPYNLSDILHIAESVSLVKSPN